MTKQEKTAIARIFDDLIKADRIVDAGEMDYWRNICEKYEIDRDIRVAARDFSFSDAVNVICESGLGPDLLGDCSAMTTSDGFCAHSEALLMIALIVMFGSGIGLTGEVHSIPRANFDIDIATAIYVEGDEYEDVNEAIRQHYRSIFKEFQLTGFHFIYIPKVIEHYRSTDPGLFRDILAFLAPTKKEADIERAHEELMKMTTDVYCKDLLCNKCGFTGLRDSEPAILIKIGNSFVGGNRYANYLKIDVAEDVLKTVQDFIDKFSEMLSSDVFVVSTSEERGDQFHFHGFYKQLLDIFLINQKTQSPIEIDLKNEKISFTGLEHTDLRLHRKEKAFYITMLCQGDDGVRFSCPRSISDKGVKLYETQLKKFLARYAYIYRLLGAENERVPDITNPKIRNPIINAIKKAIGRLEDLYNPADYMVSNHDGSYMVHVAPALISVVGKNGQKHDLLESELYLGVRKIKG